MQLQTKRCVGTSCRVEVLVERNEVFLFEKVKQRECFKNKYYKDVAVRSRYTSPKRTMT